MKNYIKYIIRDFIGLENDYEILLSKQEQILDKLTQLEIQNKEFISDNKNYYDYLTIKNALWLLFLIAFIGSGVWLYNSDLLNINTLDSIKSLGSLTKDLNLIDQKTILEAFKKLNENSVNLSKTEIKLLLEIKNLILKRGISENSSLNRPISELMYPTKGGIVWDEQS